jgi:hypothetical protein
LGANLFASPLRKTEPVVAGLQALLRAQKALEREAEEPQYLATERQQ